jgi:hypothetical protein
MKIFEVAGVGKLHGLTVMSLDAFVKKEDDDVEESQVNEFAPSGGDDGEEETLHKYARLWYNGDDDTQLQIEKILDRMGWEIGEIESEEGGAFVVQAGDINGNSYIGFNVEDLTEGWKSALGSAALAGAMALGGGMGHAHAADLSNFNTQYLQQVASGEHPRPMVSVDDAKAELQARTNGKQQSTTSKIDSPSGANGFSKEYLQKASDPNRFGRYLISVEKAQELLKQMGESALNENASKLLSAEDRNGVITVVVQAPDGTKKSVADANPRYIQRWLMKYDLRLPKSITSKFIESITEAPGDFGLGANYRAVPDDEMQAFLDRSKTKTKTKRDKFDYPYVHGSNIEVKDEGGKTYDSEALKKSIMVRPKSILGQNAKMQHSETGDEAIFDIGLPALKGLAVNEKTGQFVIVDTCPGAGACQTYCYAMKGSYVMFKAVSMGLARMLNFLLNDPEGFAAQLNQEIAAAKAKLAKKNAKMTVRWHDAGDFFSPEYLAMAYSVAEANPDVGFYAYTKMASAAQAERPKNFNMNFSQGALRSQEKKVDLVRTKHSKVVPKDMFFDLIARDGNNLQKDAKGRMQFASPENLEGFKDRLAQKYHIDKDSILTYDQMMKIPVGDTPKWNVIVMPGDGDNSANRNDVIGSYLLFH